MISLQEFQKNELIIKENDIDEYLYLIKSGMVKVVKSVENKEIEVASLKEGSFFGEMALIDDRPRTATVIAMEETVLEVFHRDSFIDIMHQNQNIAIKFLSGIFSRLRDANSKIDGSIMNENAENITEKTTNYICASISMEGITEKAIGTLPENPFNILVNNSVFNIGRKSSDPFTNNILELDDSKPLQISRNHFSLQIKGDQIAIYDIGSSLGLRLNDARIGGSLGLNGPLFLENENKLVLGSDNSQLQYKVTITIPPK